MNCLMNCCRECRVNGCRTVVGLYSLLPDELIFDLSAELFAEDVQVMKYSNSQRE